MKKFFATFLAVFMMMATSVNAETDASKAESFVKDVTAEGIKDIINANIPQKEKDERFADLFNRALDLDFIGQFVLGRYWRTATPAQRKEFISVYRQLNVSTWSKRFDEFKGKEFIFKGTTPSNSKGQVFVNTIVPMDEGEPAKVAWRVREKNGNYKVVDIVIENVSLAITARNEYSAFIKNNSGNVDALITNLKSKIQ
ncbi:MAG: ABC transporter substrate-binding protein [Alphaproteobacteria bacterium]|nr:ABC transporter substrate-binding protein [Alphaproteobacteria bacterium]